MRRNRITDKFIYNVILNDEIVDAAYYWLHQQGFNRCETYYYICEFEIGRYIHHFFFVDEQIAIQFKLVHWIDNV